MSSTNRLRRFAVALLVALAGIAAPSASWAGEILMTLLIAPQLPDPAAVGCENVRVISVDAALEAPDDGGGAGTGKAVPQPIKVVKKVDECSPHIRHAFGTGTPFDKATFVIQKKGLVTIEDATPIVHSIETSAGSKGDVTETIVFHTPGFSVTP